MHYFETQQRPHAPILQISRRTAETEITGSLDQAVVIGEGKRCLSCGNCLVCDNCWTLCPDAAVLKPRDATGGWDAYMFDYDYCKGCGLCAQECPSAYIVMQDE